MADRTRIFISYRREDQKLAAHVIYDSLAEAFGNTRVFKDIDAFEPGDDFPEELERHVQEADVFLAIIGPNWLNASHKGKRRLDNPNDWVRLEIKAALEARKRVIPVLVSDAAIPAAGDLPEDIQMLARKHVHRFSDERMRQELQSFIPRLQKMLDEAEAERADTELQAAAEAKRKAEEDAARRREEALAAERAAREATEQDLAPGQVTAMRAIQNWDFIRPRGDIVEHRDHLARFPDDETARYVRASLDALIWETIDAEDSVSLGTYLEEFSNGAHSDAARVKLAQLEETARLDAERKQQLAQERDAWAVASNADELGAYQAFLDAHPGGPNAEAAQRRIAILSQSPTRRYVLGAVAGAAVTGLGAVGMRPGGVLWNLFNDPPTLLLAHDGPVHALALSSDGRKLLSGGGERRVRLWDLQTGTSTAFGGHTNGVHALAMSGDASVALAGGDSGQLRLWDLATDTNRYLSGHSGLVRGVALSRDGRTALTGGFGGKLLLWDVDAATSEELGGHSGGVLTTAISSNGIRAVSTGFDRKTKLWNLESGRAERTWETEHIQRSVSVSSGLGMILAGSVDEKVWLWEEATGGEEIFLSRSEAVHKVALSANGQVAAAGGSDGKVAVWGVAGNTDLGSFETGEGPVRSLAISGTGDLVVAGNDAGLIHVWRRSIS